MAYSNISCSVSFMFSVTCFFLSFYPDEMSTYLEQNLNEMMSYDQLQDYDRDYY